MASPAKFPQQSVESAFKKIVAAIQDGQVLPCLAETIFTLEAIQKADRKTFLQQYKPIIDFSEKVEPDGTIKLSLSMGPDASLHPGNTPYLSSHLNDAVAAGFKILRSPRIAMVTNPQLPETVFIEDTFVDQKVRQDRFNEALREIEGRGCGIKHIKNLGTGFAAPGESWLNGIRKAPATQDGVIAKAIAEWADGDSIAAHIGYSNHFFCTRDSAKSGGALSILSLANLAWLKAKYSVEIVTPEELSIRL